MGRDNHNNRHNSKNNLPQTPKNLKIAPNKVREEFASEFAEIGHKGLKGLNKSTQYETEAPFPEN